jgi:hypothetical protein
MGLVDRLHCPDSIVPLREGKMMDLKLKYIIDRIEDRYHPILNIAVLWRVFIH